MVISAAGMAICLLCGSCGGERTGKTEERLRTAGTLLLETVREVRQEREQKEREARERAARLEAYRTCSSGTRTDRGRDGQSVLWV